MSFTIIFNKKKTGVITKPPETYSLIFLKNLEKGWYFRIMQNKKSGLVYYSYGKDSWIELNNELICTPTVNGKRMALKDVKKMLQPHFFGLVMCAKLKIQKELNHTI